MVTVAGTIKRVALNDHENVNRQETSYAMVMLLKVGLIALFFFT